MDDNGVRNTLDSLLAADPDVMDRDQLAGLVFPVGSGPELVRCG